MAEPIDPQALENASKLEHGGRTAAAVRAYLDAGAVQEAARLLKGLGRPEEGARILADAGHFVEAAKVLSDAGDRAAALDRLVRMPTRDPRYREAAREAVRLAILAGAVGVRFEQFVGPYIDGGPQENEDSAAFEALGELYLGMGMPENAEEVFTKLLEHDPENTSVAERLVALRSDGVIADRSLAG